MLIEKDYCDYDTCIALKELGYVGSSRYYYTQQDRKFHYDAYNKFYTVRTADAMGYVLAVHLYDAQKWLRGKGIIVHPQYLTNGQCWICMIYVEKKMLLHTIGRGSYNEVLNEGIKEVVKILKEE